MAPPADVSVYGENSIGAAGGQPRRGAPGQQPVRAPGRRGFGADITPVQMAAAIPRVRTQTAAWLRDLARTSPDATFPVSSPAVVLATSPAVVRQLTGPSSDDLTRETPQYSALSALTGVALLTSDAHPWRRARMVLNPNFSRERNALSAQHAMAAGAAMATTWAAAQTTDVEQLSLRAAMDVLSESLLWPCAASDRENAGAELRERLRSLIDVVLSGLHAVVKSVQWPAPAGVWTPARGTLAKSSRLLDVSCRELLSRARDLPASADGLIVRLSRAVDAGELSEDEARNELVTMIIAGHETVACALTWTLGLLALHPQHQAPIRAETQRLSGQAPNHMIDAPNTYAVVAEALRLFPPAWVMSRRALVDIETGVGTIPAGAIAVMSPYVMGRDPRVWPHPDTFDPRRFARGMTREQRGSWLPFGAGKRQCIGKDFALFEHVGLLLGLLADHVISAPHPSWQLPCALSEVTLRPRGGMKLALRELSNSNHGHF